MDAWLIALVVASFIIIIFAVSLGGGATLMSLPFIAIIVLALAPVVMKPQWEREERLNQERLASMEYMDIVNINNSADLREMAQDLKDKYTYNQLREEIEKNPGAEVKIEGFISELEGGKLLINGSFSEYDYYVSVIIEDSNYNLNNLKKGDEVSFLCNVDGIINEYNEELKDEGNIFPLRLTYNPTDIVEDISVHDEESLKNDSVIKTESVGVIDTVLVEVLDAKKSDKDSSILFNIKVVNGLNKQIKGIRGTLSIEDMFGDSLYSKDIDLIGEVIDISSVALYSNIELEGIGELEKCSLENISFVFNVDKIAFVDGSVLES